MRFVWHSLRHGAASRAYLRGGAFVLSDLLVRVRWAMESSGRHYLQSRCRCGLKLQYWPAICGLVGVAALVEADFRDRVLAVA